MGPPSDDSDDMFNTPPKRKQETIPSSSTKRKLLPMKHLLRNGDVPLLIQQSSDSDSSYTRETCRNASSSTGEKSRRVDLKNSIPKKNVTSDSDDAIDSDEHSTAPRLSTTKVGLGLSAASKLKTLVSRSSDSYDSDDDAFKRPTFRPAQVQLSVVSESDSDEGQGEPASKPAVPPARPSVNSGERQHPKTQRLSESGGHKPATRLDSLPKKTNVSSSSDSDDDFIVSSPRRGLKKAAGPQSPAVRRLFSARHDTRTVQADTPAKSSSVVDTSRRKAPVGYEIKDMPAKTSSKQSSGSESESSADYVKQRSLSKDVPAKTSNKSSGSESESLSDNVKQRSKSKDLPAKASNKQASGSDSESSADNVKQRLPAKISNKSSGSESESSADNVKQRSKSKDMPAKTTDKQSSATSSKYPKPTNVTKTAASSPRVAANSRNVQVSSDSDSESGVDNSKGRAVASPDSCSSASDDDSHRGAKPSSLKAASTVVGTNQTSRPARHEVSSSGSEGSSTEARGEGKRAGEGLRAQPGSGLVADNTPGVLYAEDLAADEEVWLVQCPMSLTREALLTFSFDLSGRVEVEVAAGDDAPVRYWATAHRRHDIAINTACLVRGREAEELKAVVVHGAGQIVVTRQFSPPVAAAPSSPPGGPIPLPGGLKVRHPLFGADYKQSILERDKSSDPPPVRVHSSKPERRSVTFASPGQEEFLPGRDKAKKKKKGETLGSSSHDEEQRGEGGFPEDILSEEARKAGKRERRKRKAGEGIGKETGDEIDQKSSRMMPDEEEELVSVDIKAVIEKSLAKERKERREQKAMKGEGDKPVTVDNREITEEVLAKERRKKERKERRKQKTMEDEEDKLVLVDDRTDEALAKERRKKERKERRKQKTMGEEEDKPVLVDDRTDDALAKERRKKERKERRERKAMKGEGDKPVLVDDRTDDALAKERRKKERKERRERGEKVDAASPPPTVDPDEEKRRAESLRVDLLSAMVRQMGGAEKRRRRDSTASTEGKPAKRRKVADSRALDVHFQGSRAHDSATKQAHASSTKQAHDSATKQARGSTTKHAHDSATKQAHASTMKHAHDSATKQAHDSATKEAHDLVAGHSAEEAGRKSKKKKKKDTNKGIEVAEGVDLEAARTGEGGGLGDGEATTPTKKKKKKDKNKGVEVAEGVNVEAVSTGEGDGEATTPTKKKKRKKKEGREDGGGLDVTLTDFAAFSGGEGVVSSTQKRAEVGAGVFKTPRPPPPLDDGERESGFESDCTAQLFVTQRPRKEVDGFESDATATLFRTQRDPLDDATPRKKKKKHAV